MKSLFATGMVMVTAMAVEGCGPPQDFSGNFRTDHILVSTTDMPAPVLLDEYRGVESRALDAFNQYDIVLDFDFGITCVLRTTNERNPTFVVGKSCARPEGKWIIAGAGSIEYLSATSDDGLMLKMVWTPEGAAEGAKTTEYLSLIRE